MASDEYRARREEDREVLRQLELQHLEALIEETPADKREELKMVVGDRSYTLEEILTEAKEGTEIGLAFLDMQARSRLERLKRRG